MIVCVLECSVCHGTFDTRKEWLSHLLQPDHQSKAREEICGWGKPERDCALVAFSALPIASLELLQFFSKKSSMTLVTDFIWFENRPKVAVIQFESKRKIKEVLSSFGGPEIRVNNQLVEFKKAGECLNLEWQELIPHHSDELLENSNKQKAESNPVCPPDPIYSAKEASSFTAKAGNTRTTTQEIDAILIHVKREVKTKPTKLLSTQYDLICQEIEISDEDFKTAQKFLQTLQTHVAKTFPGCQLVWFRNYYLKLKSTSSTDELTFFIDQKGLYGKHTTDTEASSNEFPAISNEKAVQIFSTIPRLDITKTLKQTGQLRRNFFCRTNNLKFSLVTVPFIMLPEIQACRLVSYFCSLDPRVKPLLTVIRYWANINKIRLVNRNESSYKQAPEPAALDWLVLFFLCHKMKILPTPRHITTRSLPKLNFLNVNIGITFDQSFSQEYSKRYKEPDGTELHFFNVFNLAQQFFTFYSKELGLDKGKRIVLNVMDGEIIPMEMFVKESHVLNITTKLSVPERILTRRGIKEVGATFAGSSILLLHPLYLPHGFSFCFENFIKCFCPLMKITGDKLKQAMILYKDGQEFDIKSVLKANV
ncbi:unnamed protein product [Orchesella dallaii]|uniref:C2H2-type domain-containing protein n=1 Tax=Orchesella dallaii TaxID=48710 RepID=A0ABP1S020_9HEXA